MMKNLWMVALLGTVLYAAPVRADDAVKTEEPKVTDPAKPEGKPANESQVSKLAQKYNVTEDQIRSMRTSGKGMGWGEIGHALAISQASGKTLAVILADRESGMGWGEIAKKYDLKLGDLTGKAKSIEKEGKKAEKADEKAASKAQKEAGKSDGKSEDRGSKGATKGGEGRSHGADHSHKGGGSRK